jgi:tRNA(fMet)-specific endonuclease VapC
MILLDTDHATVLLFKEHSNYEVLASRILATTDSDIALNVVSLEEQLRGWLAEVARRRRMHGLVPVYAKLAELVDFYANWEISPFTDAAATIFDDLRKQGVRIGTQDLKIASIALANGALLLSANLVHFEKVPGLKVEDWLHS